MADYCDLWQARLCWQNPSFPIEAVRISSLPVQEQSSHLLWAPGAVRLRLVLCTPCSVTRWCGRGQLAVPGVPVPSRLEHILVLLSTQRKRHQLVCLSPSFPELACLVKYCLAEECELSWAGLVRVAVRDAEHECWG